jgi:hypothetical protein
MGPSTRKACVALLAAAALLMLAFQNPHPALAGEPVTVKERLDFTNKEAFTATDFHVKIWQKEDNIHIVDFDVDDPEGGGTCSGVAGNRPNMVSDTGTHAVDVTCQGINVAPDGHLKFWFTWRLTAHNTKRLWEPTWTQNGGDAKATPSHGIEVGDPAADPSQPRTFHHSFQFCNDDATDSLTVGTLKLGSAPPPLFSFAELEAFSNWDITVGPFTLNAGQCHNEDVITLTPRAGGNIVASYTLTDGGDVTLDDRFLHEIPQPLAVGGISELPDVSGSSGINYYIALAGAAAAAALAITAGGWYARRRWLR